MGTHATLSLIYHNTMYCFQLSELQFYFLCSSHFSPPALTFSFFFQCQTSVQIYIGLLILQLSV